MTESPKTAPQSFSKAAAFLADVRMVKWSFVSNMMVRESSLVVVLRDEFFFQVGILVGVFPCARGGARTFDGSTCGGTLREATRTKEQVEGKYSQRIENGWYLNFKRKVVRWVVGLRGVVVFLWNNIVCTMTDA